MKKTLLFQFMLILALAGYSIGAKAQSLELHAVITMTDGQQQMYYLTEDNHFSFEGQETLVINTQGSTVELNIDDIRKIELVDITGTEELQAGTPFFYPNPVKRTLILGNVESGQTVCVYSPEGRLLREFKVQANVVIDLGDLPAGMYILNICDKNLKLLKL